MSDKTGIEWADSTFNPWIGCTKVGPGCDHCYAKSDFDDRKHRVTWGAGQARSRTKTWGDPVKWNKQHDAFFAEHGRRQRVFCASLADVFDNAVDPQWRHDLWQLIQDTPDLDWLLLTKRIGNVFGMLPDGWAFGHGPWPNVWIGATIVNQEEADRDIPKLLAVPAAKRFLSMEPLLGPVNLRLRVPATTPPAEAATWSAAKLDEWFAIAARAEYHALCDTMDWVIVGGESGPSARPMHPDWARSLRDQCVAAGVPFLFKQWGEWAPEGAVAGDGSPLDDAFMRNAALHICDGGERVYRVGKTRAGRLLDGVQHDGYPKGGVA